MHTMLSGMSTGRMYLLGARRGRAGTRAAGDGDAGARCAARRKLRVWPLSDMSPASHSNRLRNRGLFRIATEFDRSSLRRDARGAGAATGGSWARAAKRTQS